MSAIEDLIDAAVALADSPHILQVKEDGWGIQHPLRCRPALTECKVHERISMTDQGDFPVGTWELNEDAQIVSLAYKRPDPAVAFLAALDAYRQEAAG